MKILVSVSKVVEVEIPEDIDPEDIDDFIVDEIREFYALDWDLIGWEKVQKDEAIA